MRLGKKPDVPDETLRGWEADPEWKRRWSEAQAEREATTTAVELAPLERLRSYLDGAVCAVGGMATGEIKPCPVRLSACKDILDRLNVRAVADENQGITERFVRALCLDATLQRAQRLTLEAMQK